MNAHRLLSGSAALLACLACGCASTSFLKFGKADYPKAGPKNPVVHVMGMWQPATGVGLEGRTCRGFAGQVFFISADGPTPALIDGDIMIWLFDDQGTPQEQAKPIHKFQFDADAWKTHARKGEIGVTYSVFIPYTRKGSHAANCSLMVAYTPRGGGPTLNSEMVSVELTGSKPKTDPADDPTAETTEADAESIADLVAESGRDLGRKVAEAARVRDAGSIQVTRQESRQAAAGAAAVGELERSRTPRKLSSADEQRLIREARARLAAAGQTDDAASPVAEKTQKPKIRLRRNPLEDGDENDRNDSADVRTDLDWLKPAPGARRNPLLDSDLDENPDGR